jgi:hypothetical protein
MENKDLIRTLTKCIGEKCDEKCPMWKEDINCCYYLLDKVLEEIGVLPEDYIEHLQNDIETSCIQLIKCKDGISNIENWWEAPNYIKDINSVSNSDKIIAKNILLKFLINGYAYDNRSKKRIMQSLRHFDEIGISNEIYECLENLNDFDYFYISFNGVGDREIDLIEVDL